MYPLSYMPVVWRFVSSVDLRVALGRPHGNHDARTYLAHQPRPGLLLIRPVSPVPGPGVPFQVTATGTGSGKLAVCASAIMLVWELLIRPC